jgi:hypothetical protein
MYQAKAEAHKQSPRPSAIGTEGSEVVDVIALPEEDLSSSPE